MKINFHTHSCHCDGKGTLREYVEYAVAHGFGQLGFSGHAPVPFENNFAIHADDYSNYCDEVRALKAEYKEQIDIRLGLEIDYIPKVLDDFSDLITRGGLEYFLGGVHLVNNPDEDPNELWFIDGSKQETYDEGLQRVFHGDVRKGVTRFFHQNNEMIERTHPTIVAHFDKIVMHNKNRYFTYEERWFKELVYETVEHIHESGCIAEINTRGLYKGRHTDFYPAKETIQYMNTLGIPVLVGTDAHEPSNLDQFEGAYEFLREIGYKEIVTQMPTKLL